LSKRPFCWSSLVTSRAFWFSTAALCVVTLVMASLPLTSVLGFEYCLFFGVIATIVMSHFALVAMYMRNDATQGPSLFGTITQVILACWTMLLPPLALISLNAFRVTNCNFTYGLFLYGLTAGVGAIFGTSVGMTLSAPKNRRIAHISVYVVPIAGILWSVYYGLLHPPIYAYNPYYSFFPGTIYDELRQISTTLLVYRLDTLITSVFLFAVLALTSGREGLWGTETWTWRAPYLQRNENALDGRLSWSGMWEQRFGLVALLLVSFVWMVWSFQHQAELQYRHNSASIRKELGGVHITSHFIIHYDRDSVTPQQLQRITRDHEYRYYQLVQFFGHRPKYKIRSYVFKDTAQKSRMMGAANTMIARPWAYEYYVHGSYFPHRVIKHEMAHVFSAAFGSGPLKLSARYGLLFNAALVEGVAVAADWSSGELTPHQWSRALLDLRRAPDPANILGVTGFYNHSSLHSYTIAGSFSRYLIDKYGIKKFKRAYGTANFAEVYQKSLRTLSNEWKSFLKKMPLSQREKQIAAFRYGRRYSIFSRKCPHEVASLRHKMSRALRSEQYSRAIDLQQQVCGISPRPYYKLQLLRLKYGAKKYKEALAYAYKLENMYKDKKLPIMRLKIKLERAKIHYRLGQIEKGRLLIKSLLHKPAYLSQKRALLVRLHALSNPTFAKEIMEYLDEGSTTSLLRLQKSALQHNDPVMHYLLGRRHFMFDAYKEALEHLLKAQKSLKSHPLRVENMSMIAKTLFYLGRYDQAARAFERLSKQPLPKGLKNKALDWKQRALWEKRTYGAPPAP